MLFFQKNISSFFTALMFVSFSFVLFVFISQQVAFADKTKTDCEAIGPGAPGSSANGTCAVPPCDTATEDSLGACTGVPGKICCAPKGYSNPSSGVTICGTGNAGTCGIPESCANGKFEGGAAACSVNAVSGKTACCKPAGGGDTPVPATGACPSPNVCRSACQSGETSVSICLSGLKCCASQSTTQPSAPQNITFTNPLRFDTVEEVLTSILGTLQGIIVILALVFLVIGAVLYILSAGNDDRMKTAKNCILAAMIGLAIGIAAPSFLKEIGNVLGWGAVNSGAVAGALTLSQIARNVLNFLLSIVGILGIIMLVIGGIMYLTAAGSEERIETGKKIVVYAIIGIVVALAALVIVSQIAAFFV
ncbi:MAG: pilin [bacterium]|nr:pilin [bacterium]